MHVPILFVEGTRDKMCPISQLNIVRKKMKARNAVHVMADGDHSLELPKSLQDRQASQDSCAIDKIRSFISESG